MTPIRWWWHRITKSIQKQNTKNHMTYPSKPFLRLSGLNFHPRAEFAVLSSVSRERVVKRDRRVSHIECSSLKREEERWKIQFKNAFWGQKERVKIYTSRDETRERDSLIKKCAKKPTSTRIFSSSSSSASKSFIFFLSLMWKCAFLCAFFSSLKIKRGFFVWCV